MKKQKLVAFNGKVDEKEGLLNRKGSRIIIDDFNLCNFDLIKAAISYWDFKVLESGKHKVCFQREI